MHVDLSIGQYDISDVILRCTRDGLVETASGSLFICPLGDGDLHYLHKLFGRAPTLPADWLEDCFGFNPPEEYQSFMDRFNGATLFDRSFTLYGFVEKLDRSPTLETSQPIAIGPNVIDHLLIYGDESPWRPIGSISGYELLFGIWIGKGGEVALVLDDVVYPLFESFGEAVFSLANMLDRYSSFVGITDDDHRAVDGALLHLVKKTH